MTMPRLLLLALLLTPLAPPLAGAQATPTLEVAWTEAGDLQVHVAGSAAFSGRVLVHHVDALAGTVVDRLVGVQVGAGERVSFTVPGLPAETALRVSLLAGTDGPDRLPYAQLYDGATVARLSPLAQADAPPRQASTRAQRVDIWNVTGFPRDDGVTDHRMLVTTDGIVAVGFAHRPTGVLAVRLSRDGGHTWPEEHRLTAGPADTEYTWDMAETASGEIGVVYRGRNSVAEDWHHKRIGPLDRTVRTLPDTAWERGGVGYGAMDPKLLPDGTALWAATPASSTGAQAYRLAPGAPAALLGTVAWPTPFQSLRITGDGARAAIAFVANDRLYVSRSADGGATFGAAAEMRSLTRVHTNATVAVDDVRLSPDGTVHALAFFLTMESPSSATFDEYYVRLDATGADTTRQTSVRGSGHMATKGDRVVVQGWDANGMSLHESRDGGRSFRSPVYVDPMGAVWAWGGTTQLALLPDGRVALSGRTMQGYPEPRVGVGVALPFDPEPGEAPVFVVQPPQGSPPGGEPRPGPAPLPPPTSVATTPVATAPIDPTPVVEAALRLVPDRVSLAPGATVIVHARLEGIAQTSPAQLPSFVGLPSGVHGTVLRAPGDGEFQLALTADPGAAAGTATAMVVVAPDDLEPLFAPLAIEVASAASTPIPVPTPSAVPAAAWILGGVGAAAGAVVVAARTDLGKLLAGAALAPLYTRIKRSDVLRNEVRAGVYEEIRAHPGARFEELRQALAVPSGVLTFHLGVLEREGYVRVVRDWTRRRYFAQGAPLPVAASTTEQTLEGLLRREPGMSAGEVASRLGISRQLARYHLKRLERQGWVQADGVGGSVGYRLVRR